MIDSCDEQTAWGRQHAHCAMASIRESIRTLSNETKESLDWEPVLNKNRFSIPIPREDRVHTCERILFSSPKKWSGPTSSTTSPK